MTLHADARQVQVRLTSPDFQRGGGLAEYVGTESLYQQKMGKDCQALNQQWRKDKK